MAYVCVCVCGIASLILLVEHSSLYALQLVHRLEWLSRDVRPESITCTKIIQKTFYVQKSYFCI